MSTVTRRLFSRLIILFVMAFGTAVLYASPASAKVLTCEEECAEHRDDCELDAETEYHFCEMEALNEKFECLQEADYNNFECEFWCWTLGGCWPDYCEVPYQIAQENCNYFYTAELGNCDYFRDTEIGLCTASYNACVSQCPLAD